MDLFAENERASFGGDEIIRFADRPTDNHHHHPARIAPSQSVTPSVFPRRSYQSVFSPKTKPTQEEGGEWAVKAVGRDPLGIGRASRK